MFVGHFWPPGSGYGSRDPIESESTTLVSTLEFNEVTTGNQKSNEMKHFYRYHKVRLKLF
jgi:hypothetical protein